MVSVSYADGRARPICYCENPACPVGKPTAFAPLDVRIPPKFCKFCSAPFVYLPSDCYATKGKGKGKAGKGGGTGNYGKGNGKGKGKKSYDSYYINEEEHYDTYGTNASQQAPPDPVAATMQWLVGLGLQPDVLHSIAQAAKAAGHSPSRPSPAKPITELQQLKINVKNAESEFRDAQNQVKQGITKQKKLHDIYMHNVCMSVLSSKSNLMPACFGNHR